VGGTSYSRLTHSKACIQSPEFSYQRYSHKNRKIKKKKRVKKKKKDLNLAEGRWKNSGIFLRKGGRGRRFY
jgi:hypothetical protein